MATNTEIFRSEGGFGINEKTIVSADYDIKNVNSLELKNSNYNNCLRTDYILRRVTTAAAPNGVLSLLSASTEPITLPTSSVNFITGHVVGTNSNGSGFYVLKIENTVTVDALGDVQSLSNLTTIIKDSIPSGEGWTVSVYDIGQPNEFSYIVGQGVAAGNILWTAHVQVITADW